MWQDFEAACGALPTKQFALNRTSKVDSNTDFSKKINFVIYLIKILGIGQSKKVTKRRYIIQLVPSNFFPTKYKSYFYNFNLNFCYGLQSHR